MHLTKIYRAFFLLLCGIFVFTLVSFSQKTHFVYLQSENQQPFYVLLDGKNVSSSSIGYVILSKLTSGDYPIQVGFPKTDGTVNFNLQVGDDDAGYVIKDLGEKGWALFNIQTLAVQPSAKKVGLQDAMVAEEARKAAEEKRIADSLRQITANRIALQRQQDSLKNAVAARTAAAEDFPSEQTTAKETTPIPTPPTTAVINPASSPVVPVGVPVGEVVTGAAVKTETEASPKEFTSPVAPSKSSNPVDSATFTKELIKMDRDTVAVTEPVTTSVPLQENRQAALPSTDSMMTQKAEPLTTPVTTTPTVTTEPTKVQENNPKFLDMDMEPVSGYITKNEPVQKSGGLTSNNANTKILTVPVEEKKPTAQIEERKATPATTVKNDCKEYATDKDFFSLRKKMASETESSEMVKAASKFFKDKCFSTEQVRHLCVLLLDDQGRYDFLDQAYNATSDPENFSKLADLLQDDYYLRRFKAMLR